MIQQSPLVSWMLMEPRLKIRFPLTLFQTIIQLLNSFSQPRAHAITLMWESNLSLWSLTMKLQPQIFKSVGQVVWMDHWTHLRVLPMTWGSFLENCCCLKALTQFRYWSKTATTKQPLSKKTLSYFHQTKRQHAALKL